MLPANGSRKIEFDSDYGEGNTATLIVSNLALSPIPVTGVTLGENQDSLTLTVGGDTATLTATVAPANAANKTVVWTSSDESVATVANGVVTAVAAGTATATNGTDDTADDFTATCEVAVNAAAATGAYASYVNTTTVVSFDGKDWYLIEDKATAVEGDTVTLTVTPEEGCTLSSLTVMQGETAITVTDSSFIMPAGDVTVTAAFVPVFGPATFTLPAANAFKDCTGLTQIRLPKNCTIDGTAFSGCDSLIAVFAPAGGTTEAWANSSGIVFVAE